jgi:hypothetical protein
VDQSEDQLQLEQEQYESQTNANNVAASQKATPAKKARKRQKTTASKGDGAPDGTSVESELRQQSMHSLLDLMNRDYSGPRPGEPAAAGANGATPTPAPRAAPIPSPSFGPPVIQGRAQQFGPPAPYPCEICTHFGSRVCSTPPRFNLKLIISV